MYLLCNLSNYVGTHNVITTILQSRRAYLYCV